MTENRDVESKLDAYVLKAEFENKVELNECLKIPTRTVKTNKTWCTMCDKRGDHQMRVRYLVCKNKECNETECCQRKLKTTTCLKYHQGQRNNVFLYANGHKHNS